MTGVERRLLVALPLLAAASLLLIATGWWLTRHKEGSRHG